MKPVILAEKPSQGKAYADAFSVSRHEGYLEIHPTSIFTKAHTLLGHRPSCRVERAKSI